MVMQYSVNLPTQVPHISNPSHITEITYNGRHTSELKCFTHRHLCTYLLAIVLGCQLLTLKAWAQSQGSSYGLCNEGQSGNGAVSLLALWFSPASYTTIAPYYHLEFIQ
jgi:hypothetical protein